ncbi:MAG: hypothetical protein K0Q57_1285, partial [Gammaproteobacteria bacterium]|nr:hypothetical protein [Gammaproteobacteria bacterium]
MLSKQLITEMVKAALQEDIGS